MKEIISPEEKLLRLIRGEKKQPAQAKAGNNPSAGAKSSPPHAPRAVILPSSFLNPRIIIRTGFVLACLYLIASMLYPVFTGKKIVLPKIKPAPLNSNLASEKIDSKPYEFYLEGIKGKHIFGQSQTGSGGNQPLSVAPAELLKDFSLVGIISGYNPQAIIEDKKAQKNYYLSKGQSIGEFQVEDIREGRIVLNYRGQQFELFL